MKTAKNHINRHNCGAGYKETAKNSRILCVVSLLFTGVLLFSHTVTASGVNLKNLPPLKPVEFMPEAEFEEQTRLIEETPFDDTFMAYSVRLPKDWTPSVEPPKDYTKGGSLSERLLGILARYVSPPHLHQRSSFTLEALHLSYEIDARNWFINYALANGYVLEGINALSERRGEAIYVEVSGDTTYAVRLAAVINGPRIVIARYAVPQDLFAQERVMQAQSINSFRLLNFEETGVEERKSHAFLDQSQFNYPASWETDIPPVRSIERMKGTVFHGVGEEESRKIWGQINIYLISKLVETNLVEEIRRYRRNFTIKGYTLGGLLEKKTIHYHPDIEFGATEIYRLVPDNPATMPYYELWISAMYNKDYYYIITLITPAREEEFYLWARNGTAYEIIVSSTRLTNERF